MEINCNEWDCKYYVDNYFDTKCKYCERAYLFENPDVLDQYEPED